MNRPQHLPTLFGRVSLVSDGHTTLRDSSDVLRGLCGGAESGGAPPDREMLACLDRFAQQVLAHFALEESRSYFGTVAEDSPQLADQIAHLKGEHRTMRADLRRLRAAAGTSPRPSEFAAELQRFLDGFEAHEQQESRVLEKFFLEEAEGAG